MKPDILYEGLTAKDLKPEAREAFSINQDAERTIADSSPPISSEGLHLEDVLIETRAYSPPDILVQEMLRDHVLEVFAELTERERYVLKQRFGLDDGRERTLEEIGEDLGMHERGKPLTKERIRQIEAKALKKLRRPENRQHMRDYLE